MDFGQIVNHSVIDHCNKKNVSFSVPSRDYFGRNYIIYTRGVYVAHPLGSVR